jgi:hypothetical protein
MSYQAPGPQGLDYKPCRYGASRLTFRGPARSVDKPFIAFLGSTETYGKYVPKPFPALVEERMGTSCINLGCVNAGHDVYLNDPYVMELAGQARICVLQISGAQNMSNRFYTVHPRRNDRFLKASRFMQQIFRDVDFTDFAFTRHMLDSLHRFAPDRFAMLRDELQEAWVARTRLLIERLEGRVILLWFAGHRPPTGPAPDGVGPDPLFIERRMIEAVQDQAAGVVEATISAAAMAAGQSGMVIPPAEAQAAAEMPGPAAHADAAEMLLPALRRYI